MKIEARKENQYRGSRFDDFLEEEGILEECTAVAVKRVFAMEMADAMKKEHVNKTAMAKKMHTTRSQLDRVLSADETGTTIDTLVRAAVALGKKLEIRLA